MCIVSEDEIYEAGKLIPPKQVKEADGHCEWVKEKAELLDISNDARIITIFITIAKNVKQRNLVWKGNILFECRRIN